MEFMVNGIPVAILAILFMPLGAFLYSEKGLGTMWLQAIKMNREEIDPAPGEMVKLMGGAFLASVLTVYLLAVLIASLNISIWSELMLLLFIVYLIVFLIRLKGTIFEGNFLLFKVNMLATLSEFALAFVVFSFFI